MDFSSRRKKADYNIIHNRSLKYVDYPIFFIVAMLLMLGLVSLFSASALYAANKGLDTLFYTQKQALYIFLGFGLMMAAAKLDLERIRPYIKPAVIVTIILLGVTLLMPPVAHVRRWIPLGFMKLQTSEFAKIILVLYLADFFDRSASRLNTDLKQMAKPVGVIVLMLALIAAGPDLGTPALLFAVACMMFFAAGLKLRYLLMPLGAGLLILVEELIRKPYRLARLKNFLSPWDDASGTGYQLVQALLAVGSGGWFGKGLGASKLKLMYLPEPHTDFIFPVVAEELGLVGGLFITALFAALLVKGARIARNAPSLYTSTAALGLTLVITLQAFFNLAMAIGLVPTKGIPLPFFSYGGSSIWASMIMVGLILNISAHRSGSRW
ncbi:MAG TPA: putative lipid II flippase FtsW [Elusimicrobia bacterium]|nr:MAG: cell division protein FtsW [Elusimicrobia bacterium GWA2_64_40]OGR66911.1 MAG: cell division protein FtsW [Elusimicrobia bacterium GWB2_63_16]HAN05432.1 putative lipid II flippase FtsW [Elusimicrobiota bacterium]HAU89590.1 putative lipid II flippase FtsW [Elusimicrobiota bacterium]